MSQEYTYPSAASSNASVGPTGTTAPTSATEIAGVNAGNLVPISVDSTGAINVNIASEPGAPFHVIVDSSALPTGASTSANQTTANTALNALNARTAGSLTPVAYDEVDLTYVPSGNGAGQVATATYKLASATVKTLTLTYDSSNRLSTVVAS